MLPGDDELEGWGDGDLVMNGMVLEGQGKDDESDQDEPDRGRGKPSRFPSRQAGRDR